VGATGWRVRNGITCADLDKGYCLPVLLFPLLMYAKCLFKQTRLAFVAG